MTNDSRTVPRGTVWLLVFGWFTAVGFLLFTYRYLEDLAIARTGTFWARLIEQFTGAYAAAVLFPLVVIFARRYRLAGPSWWRRLPLHVGALAIFSVAHTTLMAISRHLIFPLTGLGPYDYGIMSIRYPMELANDVITYWVFIGAIYTFDYYRESHDREMRTLQLESRLAQSQLQTLRLQLQPHFLFNALNTISAILYENVELADQMITRLSDLLRRTLRDSPSQEVTLSEELEFLDLYLEIMRARFEERLIVNLEVESATQAALVPQLILQPLVENSIKHAMNPQTGAVAVIISVKHKSGWLIMEVGDNGPGLVRDQASVLRDGIGLSNTAARLHQLYGARHKFTLGNAAGGGLLVKIEMPFHTHELSHETNGRST